MGDIDLKLREMRTNRAEIDALMSIVQSQAVTTAKVGSIEILLSAIREEQKSAKEELRRLSESMEIRIRKLEDWRTEQRSIWKVVAGVASVIGAVFGGVISYIASHWKQN